MENILSKLHELQRHCKSLKNDETCQNKVDNKWTCKHNPIKCCAMCKDCESDKCNSESFCAHLYY